MKYRNKIIIGTILLIIGIVSLVFGFLIYIDTSGVNVLLYIGRVHSFAFDYVLARILIIWGTALIAAAIVLYMLVALKKEFSTKKPLAVAISVLIIGLAVTGFFIAAVAPPSLHAKAELAANTQYTQVGSSKPVTYNVSSYSNYLSMEYFNVSLNGKIIFNQSLAFKGYKNTTFCIPTSTFLSPGNYTVNTTIAHGSTQKTFKSWIDVKAYSPMRVYVTGPTNVTDGYTGSYSAHVTGGYGPYNVVWCISGLNNHKLSGNTVSFTFGNSYFGYNVKACAFDAYGAENVSSLTVYLASNLSASFTCSYQQLDQYMTDTFNSSIFSYFEQTGIGPYTYSWYENGNLFSSSANSSYEFQTPGIYNITLEVKDSENQISEYSKNIQVNSRFTLWSYSPLPSEITGSQSIDFWYNVTGGTWLENVSGFGHYDATFYVNGQGYLPYYSIFSDDIGHYEFTLSPSVLSPGENSFKVVLQDGVGQLTSPFSIEIYYTN